MDIPSEAELQKIKHKVPSEIECFQLLLQENDLKVKLAVLFLIKQQKEVKYLPITEAYINADDPKLRAFAREAKEALASN